MRRLSKSKLLAHDLTLVATLLGAKFYVHPCRLTLVIVKGPRAGMTDLVDPPTREEAEYWIQELEA